MLSSSGVNGDPLSGVPITPVKPAYYVFETRGPDMILSMSLAIAIMIIITCIRLGIRFRGMDLRFGWDDWVIIPGLLLAITWPALQIAAVIYGGSGKHLYDVTYEEYGIFHTLNRINELVFCFAIALIKVSICLFNKRLTCLASRAWIVFNNAFLALLLVYMAASLFATVVQCPSPFGKTWADVRGGAGCDGLRRICGITLGIILDVIHDVIYFGFLPAPLLVLWRVKMRWGIKLRLYALFALGGIIAFSSVMKQMEKSKLSSDILFMSKPAQDWTLVDITFSLFAASFPILPAIVPHAWRWHLGSAESPGLESCSTRALHEWSSRIRNLNGRRAAPLCEKTVGGLEAKKSMVMMEPVHLGPRRADDVEAGAVANAMA